MTSFFSSNLAKRVGSAVVLIPLVLGGVWIGGPFYALMIVGMMLIALREWLGLTAKDLSQRGKTWAYGSTLFVMAMAVTKDALPAIGLALFAAFILVYYAQKMGRTRRDALWVGMGIPYVFFSALALIYLRNNDSYGFVTIIYLLVVVWGTDTGAYIAGRTIGGPKLWPRVSPNKTWAGLVGGMAAAALLGYGVAARFAFPFAPLEAAMIALVLAVIAQAGDFFESHVKRRFGAKDSGTLIPGHGGMLDRVDGLLFAAVAWAVVVMV